MKPTYELVLYTTGDSPNSVRAKANLHQLCLTHLASAVDLVVVDVLKHPMKALADGVFATPTLIKRAPGAKRVIIGDLSRTQELLVALEVSPAPESRQP